MSTSNAPTIRLRLTALAVAVVAVAAAAASIAAAPAAAEFAGRNGRIYFTSPSSSDFPPACGAAAVSPAGTAYECLTRDGFDPSVSPNGRLISEIAGDPPQVYTANINGKHLRRLTHTHPAHSLAATFSPDSRRILYFEFFGAHDGVYLMNADGSAQRQLTSDSGLGPVFSPNGTQIAYYQSPGIILAGANGSLPHVVLANQNTTTHGPIGTTTTLTRSTVENSEPNWSPDGRRLAFTRESMITVATCNLSTRRCTSTHSDAIDVFTMNPDGTSLRQLTSSPSVDESEPSWSPDGRQIAYFHHLRADADGIGEVWVMNADGSGKRAIAQGQSPYWSSVQGGPGRPRLQLQARTIKRHPRCLGRFDGFVGTVKTRASQQTQFDLVAYIDGHPVDSVSQDRGLGTGVEFLRRGRHQVRIVASDFAAHDVMSRTLTFRRC